jgi:trigger factor
VTIDVPESMVHRELDRRLEEFVRRLMDQGVDPMKANINWDEFRTEQRPMAIDTVKSAIVLDDVARREDVSIGGAELDEELGKYATASGRSVSAVRARLEEDGGLGRLATGMRRDKTVEYLMSRATIQGA